MLKNLLASFLPNLIPAFGALANPWVLVAILVYGACMFGSGIYLESGRYQAFVAQQKLVAAGQERRAAERAAFNKQLKKDTDDAYTTANGQLATRIASLDRRLQERPSGSDVSAGQQPAGSKCPDGQVCYDRGEFDGALRVFGDETRSATRGSDKEVAVLVGEGAALKLKLDTAIAWVDTQRKQNGTSHKH